MLFSVHNRYGKCSNIHFHSSRRAKVDVNIVEEWMQGAFWNLS